jgi:phytoene dehydrogenase-like protein/uncharacterized membrane protein
VYWSFSGPGLWAPAILGGLLFAAGLVVWRYLKRHDVKTMEVVSLGYFAVHAIVTLGLGLPFIKSFGPVINNLTLAGMAWGTLLAGSPFTYQYAREDWPREVWSNPLFRRTNSIITGVWGVIFLVNTVLGALSLTLPRYQILLNAIIANLLIGCGIFFSARFPKWFTRHEIQKQIDAREPYRWADPDFRGERPPGENAHDVIVIGSGIGGLTCAALLAKRSLKVAVFEQHSLPGGFCVSWERTLQRGNQRLRYVFDAGVHDVSGLGERGPVCRLMKQLDVEGEIDWRRMDHEYFIEGVHLSVPRDAREFVAALAKEFPAEKEPIFEFFEQMRHIYREMYSDIDKTGGVPTYPRTVDDMLAYPASHPHAMRWMDRPFSEMLDRYFKDLRLKKLLTVLTGYLSDDPTVLTTGALAPIFGYYFDGGYYPAGGSQVLANVLVSVIERHGGHVHLRTPVEHIMVDNGRAAGVRLASGDVHHAKTIISDADLRRTFLDLVGSDHLPPHFARQLEVLQPSTSAFIVFVGLDFVPQLASISITDGVGIMIPSKADPSLAPPGHAAMTLLRLVPQREVASWDREAPNYAQRKRELGDELIARAERVIPKLREHIVYRQEGAPTTFARFAWTTGGSIYGPVRNSNRPTAKSPLPGLYLAGSGVFPGAGIEAVVISGTLAADAIYRWPIPERASSGNDTPIAASRHRQDYGKSRFK